MKNVELNKDDILFEQVVQDMDHEWAMMNIVEQNFELYRRYGIDLFSPETREICIDHPSFQYYNRQARENFFRKDVNEMLITQEFESINKYCQYYLDNGLFPCNGYFEIFKFYYGLNEEERQLFDNYYDKYDLSAFYKILEIFPDYQAMEDNRNYDTVTLQPDYGEIAQHVSNYIDLAQNDFPGEKLDQIDFLKYVNETGKGFEYLIQADRIIGRANTFYLISKIGFVEGKNDIDKVLSKSLASNKYMAPEDNDLNFILELYSRLSPEYRDAIKDSISITEIDDIGLSNEAKECAKMEHDGRKAQLLKFFIHLDMLSQLITHPESIENIRTEYEHNQNKLHDLELLSSKRYVALYILTALHSGNSVEYINSLRSSLVNKKSYLSEEEIGQIVIDSQQAYLRIKEISDLRAINAMMDQNLYDLRKRVYNNERLSINREKHRLEQYVTSCIKNGIENSVELYRDIQDVFNSYLKIENIVYSLDLDQECVKYLETIKTIRNNPECLPSLRIREQEKLICDKQADYSFNLDNCQAVYPGTQDKLFSQSPYLVTDVQFSTPPYVDGKPLCKCPGWQGYQANFGHIDSITIENESGLKMTFSGEQIDKDNNLVFELKDMTVKYAIETGKASFFPRRKKSETEAQNQTQQHKPKQLKSKHRGIHI